jgi:aspartate kinase
MKFGGTSVGSAEAIQRVASIVDAQRERRPVVVVSAIGGTTQQLLNMATEAARGRRNQALLQLEETRAVHEGVVQGAISQVDRRLADHIVDSYFCELRDIIEELLILGELPRRTLDTIASYGERLSSELVTLAFRQCAIESVGIDARGVIVTDARHTRAMPLYPQTYSRLRDEVLPFVQKDRVVVLGGFIGSTEDGITTTLGRGGSDFTAAIVGAGIDADEIQIWTDVDGVMTCDPKMVPEARRVKTISFAEAAELAYFGAKVLHPATLLPAIEKNIPICVLNSRRPDLPGTRIEAESVPCRNVIKAISCKRHVSLINIRSTRMLMAYGFLHRIFEVFDRAETPVDMLASSEVSVSLTIDDASRLDEICEELRQFSEVTIDSDQAIVCVVGDNIRYTPGVAARVFGALGEVNVRMISQGASLLNLSFVVAAEDVQKAVVKLHEEFFKDPDPAVFN